MCIYKNIHPNKTFLTEAFLLLPPHLKNFSSIFFKYFVTKRQFFSPYQQVFFFLPLKNS